MTAVYERKVWRLGPARWGWEARIRAETAARRDRWPFAKGTATSHEKAIAAALAAIDVHANEAAARWVVVP